jgi:hypothetical protein
MSALCLIIIPTLLVKNLLTWRIILFLSLRIFKKRQHFSFILNLEIENANIHIQGGKMKNFAFILISFLCLLDFSNQINSKMEGSYFRIFNVT